MISYFQQTLVVVAQNHCRLAEIAGPIQRQFPHARIVQAANGEIALEALHGDVDMLITAEGSMEMSAATLVQRAKAMNPSLPVVVVGHGCDQFRAFAAGANGFVHFNEEAGLLEAAMRFVRPTVAAEAA